MAGFRKRSGFRPRNKFGARKSIIDGITWDSEVEGRRYVELKLLQKKGIISNLRWKIVYYVRYPVTGPFEKRSKSKLMFRYIADFVYIRDGEEIIEDVKGSKRTETSTYRLKKKILQVMYGLKIREYYEL